MTESDIDFEHHVINVERQLIRLHDGNKMLYYIEEPKTENGIRKVPMLPDVENLFREVIEKCPALNKEFIIWNEDRTKSATGFLWLEKDNKLEVAQHWQNHFRWACMKFNRVYKDEIPNVTPHVCRHTFCSNCASAGMSPKTLQVIMGHSSIEITLDVYTHIEVGDVQSEFLSIADNTNYNIYPLTRKPEIVSVDTDEDMDEPEVDFSEKADDED